MNFCETVAVDNKEFTFNCGKLARQADGAIMATLGETVVLVTAVASSDNMEPRDFLPLTVDYLEKTSAAGKFPGGFYKREGKLSDKAILVSRIIDRSLRPSFPDGYSSETQIVATVLSHDKQNEGDVLALTAASMALCVSDIPFNGPLAGIRVGKINGELIAYPTFEDLEKSDIDIIMAVGPEGIVMVEGGANMVSEEEVIEALIFGEEQAKPLLDFQNELLKQNPLEKRSFEVIEIDQEIDDVVVKMAFESVSQAVIIPDKKLRYSAVREIKHAVKKALTEQFEDKEKLIITSFEKLKRSIVRSMIVHDRIRIDGRSSTDIRPISCDVGVLPRVHGSAIFTRGETQALVSATLGTAQDEQRVEDLTGESFKRFLLHYNFPPYSVGEARFMRGPGRREIGHGALAERALLPVIPDNDKFNYTIRLVSEILESNGSSSMASVCGGCLSLMDAGVPISTPIAGIAMGLIKEDDKVVILSDILGDEDHLGDMDFKVTGSEKGITALQMDIKIANVDRDLLKEALGQAKEGRLYILDKMVSSLEEPRASISQYAPRITSIKVPQDKIKDVIGPGGKNIKAIIAETGVTINVNDSGKVDIASSDSKSVDDAIKMVKNYTGDVEPGEIFKGKVVSIKDFGAFIEIKPGVEGLLHISEISEYRVKRVSDHLNFGDIIKVKVIEVDANGRIRLSKKQL